MPNRSDLAYVDGVADVSIRDADGGWIIKFAKAFTDDNQTIVGEKLCYSVEEVLEWLAIELPAIKQYWNLKMMETKGETTMREFIKEVETATDRRIKRKTQ